MKTKSRNREAGAQAIATPMINEGRRALEELRALDMDRMSPMQAWEALKILQDMAGEVVTYPGEPTFAFEGDAESPKNMLRALDWLEQLRPNDRAAFIAIAKRYQAAELETPGSPKLRLVGGDGAEGGAA